LNRLFVRWILDFQDLEDVTFGGSFRFGNCAAIDRAIVVDRFQFKRPGRCGCRHIGDRRAIPKVNVVDWLSRRQRKREEHLGAQRHLSEADRELVRRADLERLDGGCKAGVVTLALWIEALTERSKKTCCREHGLRRPDAPPGTQSKEHAVPKFGWVPFVEELRFEAD